MHRLTLLIAAIIALSVTRSRADQAVFVDDDAPLGGDGTTWASAFRFLQDALANVSEPVEIRLAGGVYRPDESSASPSGSGDRTISFVLPSEVVIVGGYAGITATDPDHRDILQFPSVLDGDLLENDTPDVFSTLDNAFRVVACDTGGHLDGVTVRAGRAFGNTPSDRGGGLHHAGGALLITNCSFEDNQAFDGGGAYSSAGQLNVQGCQFRANSAGMGGGLFINGALLAEVVDCTFSQNAGSIGLGLNIANGAAATIRRCHFSDNGAPHSGAGGGIAAQDCDPTIVDSTFERNHVVGGGGGIVTVNSNALIVNCAFRNNLADGDGGDALFHSGGSPRCWNCVLFLESAGRFGNAQVISVSANTEYRHCTIAQHLVSGFSIAFFVQDGSLSLSNCILWGHRVTGAPVENAQIWNLEALPGEIDVQYSILEGWSGVLGGLGNGGADPQFISLPNGVLRPVPGSPANDAGSNDLAPPDLADLDGDGETGESLSLDLLRRQRRTDDALAPDVGQGTPPIVDLGPYESAAWPGDCNADGWITLVDFAGYDGCVSGPSEATLCPCTDADGDGDADLSDFASVQAAFER